MRSHFTTIVHLQQAPSVWKMCLIPDIPRYPGENIIIFSNKTFQVLIFEKKETLPIEFGKYLDHGNTYKFCVIKSLNKMLDRWPFIMIRMDIKLSFYYLRNKITYRKKYAGRLF